MGIFTGVLGAWLLRRGMELGGIIGGVILLYQGLDPVSQAAIQRILTGGWREVPLGALIPLGVSIWGYVWSLRATTKDQVVSDGQKVTIKELPKDTQTLVKAKTATAVEKRPTLWERLTKR